MATTQNETIFEPQVVYLVDDDTDTALANMARDSLTIALNEENDEWEPHSSRSVVTIATTSQPELAFDMARGVDAEALNALGVRDDTDEGRYVRGTDREFNAIELWYYTADADPAVDEPELIDRFEDSRVEIGSIETDGSVAVFDATVHVQGDVYLDYDEAV